jgi:hypothetical protein
MVLPELLAASRFASQLIQGRWRLNQNRLCWLFIRLLPCRKARSLDRFRATDCRMLALVESEDESLPGGKRSREGFL